MIFCGAGFKACFRRGGEHTCNLRGKDLIYGADASWRNMALAVWLSHRVISDYLECLWKNASATSHRIFAANLCGWTNARSTIEGNLCMNHALPNASKKGLREAKQRLDGRKYDGNDIDLLDMW